MPQPEMPPGQAKPKPKPPVIPPGLTRDFVEGKGRGKVLNKEGVEEESYVTGHTMPPIFTFEVVGMDIQSIATTHNLQPGKG